MSKHYSPLLVAVALHLCTFGIRADESELARSIKDRGGEVVVDKNAPGAPVIELYMGANFTNDDCKRVCEFKSLRVLFIPFSKVDDDGLKELKGHPNLEKLSLAGTKITDAGLKHFKDFKNLKELSIASNLNIFGSGLKDLAECKKLEVLDIGKTQVGITGTGLKDLKGAAGLRSLRMESSIITEEAMAGFEDWTTLRELHLRGNEKITRKGLAYLKGLKELRVLDLRGADLTDAGLKELSGFVKLTTLLVEGKNITDDGIEALAGMIDLTTLELFAPKLTDRGAAKLVALAKLAILNLSESKLTDDGMVELAKLDKLRSLSLDKTGLTDSGLKHLEKLDLKELTVNGTAVTASGVAEFQKASPRCKVFGAKN